MAAVWAGRQSCIVQVCDPSTWGAGGGGRRISSGSLRLAWALWDQASKTKGRGVRRDENEAMLGSDRESQGSGSSLKKGLKRTGSPGLIPPPVSSPVPSLSFEEACVDLVQADGEPPSAALLTTV